MSLIDKSYFRLNINVPDDKYNPLQDLINHYEPEILKKLLGLELYKLVIDENNNEQRIVNIRDGVEYEVDDVLYEWIGLVNDDKISLIAYYVYYWHLRLNLSETSTTGEIQVFPENANIANASLKIMDAWQRLSELYGSELQPENYKSLYAYLKEYEDDYPEWQFEELGSVNAMDL